MHFSIPETQELYEEISGSTYTGYKIYINGNYHCCLRYKHLHMLHQELRRCCIYLNVQLPNFPPKRLLPLTSSQQEVRRAALEHYLQLIGQDPQISKLEHFKNFLLKAQQETATSEGLLDNCGDFMSEASIDILLMNGYLLQVSCRVGDNATALLMKACKNLKLPEDMMPYFCFFLVHMDDSKNSIFLLRRLMDFESPYISRLQAKPCQILLRTSYWNSMYDLNVQQDPNALNLLFIQTVKDMEQEWIIVPPDVGQKLHSLQQHGLKKEYLEMARQLPLYGCLQFSNAEIDYPEPQTSTLISIGNRELSMRTAKGTKIYETKFRVTRMRCWRVTTIHNVLQTTDISPSNLQLSFEYLMSKQSMRWITITSPQAMLMSVCLQHMVDELLTCRDSKESSEKSEHAQICAYSTSSSSLPFGNCNGRVSQSALFSSSSTTSLSNDKTSTSISDTGSSNLARKGAVTFLSQRRLKQNHRMSSSKSYSAVFFRNADESVHNEAFEGIGDDDL